MNKKKEYTLKFEVLSGYYIDIHYINTKCREPTMNYGHFRYIPEGECYISVYKSLDKTQGNSVESVVEVGGFEIKGTQEMKATDFLKKISEGLENLIDSKKG